MTRILAFLLTVCAVLSLSSCYGMIKNADGFSVYAEKLIKKILPYVKNKT